jgi:hypothetical protein
VIKSLRLKQAPGLDQVTPKMLKKLPQKGIVLLTYIFKDQDIVIITTLAYRM